MIRRTGSSSLQASGLKACITLGILLTTLPKKRLNIIIAQNDYKSLNSTSSGIKAPFGYLKASVKGTCINLFVMPYNYPVLFPLLEELIKEFRMQPSNQWITDFKSYVSSMPIYYYMVSFWGLSLISSSL